MNCNQIVIAALTSLSIPVEPNVYTGTATKYITFNYSDERPVLRAGDVDLLDETTIQVHMFIRGNPQADKKSIRRLLRTAGFTIISTQEFYEIDTAFTHIIVECWLDGVIED